MTVKQLSVFIENRQGRLGEVLRVLKENGVNILSLSLADTTEYGLLRLVVNEPEMGCEVLLKAGFSSTLTDVLILKIPHVTGCLQNVLSRITEAGINIEYMYGLTVKETDASIVMKTNALDDACRVLKEEHIDTLTQAEMRDM